MMLSDRAVRRRSTLQPPRAVRSLEVASVIGALIALYLILGVPPSTVWIRGALVVDLSATVASLTSLIAYRLSIRLYQSRRERGDVRQSMQHGAVAGGVVLLVLGLQLLRLLHPVSIAVLVAGFAIGELYVFLRREA